MELKRYKKNGDERKKRTLASKAINSFDYKDQKFDEIETKDKENKMALLSKKLQRILNDKRIVRKGKYFLKWKIQVKMSKMDLYMLLISQTHNQHVSNARNLAISN